MNQPDKPADVDAWLEQDLPKPEPPAPAARTQFPTPPTGRGVPPKAEPPKQKSLKQLGITKGGVVKNPSTVVRTQLENPVTNPKSAPIKAAKTVKSSALDKADFTPEVAVPAMMTGMDVDLEKRAQELAQQAGGILPAPPEEVPDHNPAVLTLNSTLLDLLKVARENGGTYEIGTNRFLIRADLHPTSSFQ